MGRFDPTYTDAQHDAIAAAINQRGLTAPDVVRLAAAGELDGVEAFTIPETTVRDVAATQRKGEPAPGPEVQEARLAKIVDETLTMVERDIEAVNAKQQKNGRLENTDLTRLTKLARTLKANLELSNALKLSARRGQAAPSPTRPPSSPDFLERLLADFQGETEPSNGTGPKP